MSDLDQLRAIEKMLEDRLEKQTASLKQELVTIRRAIEIAERYSGESFLNQSKSYIEKITELNEKTPIIDAIKFVMMEEPDRRWRGVEIAKNLKDLEYGANIKYLQSKISTILSTYAKANTRRPAIFSMRRRKNNPEYKLVSTEPY